MNIGFFTPVSLFLTQNSPPSSYNDTLGGRKLSIASGSIFSEICFPQHQKGVEKTMIYFIRIQ